jgi:Family of unknown function (DUF5320)
MPGYDATGPWGRGPGTGWGRGPCGAGLRRGGGFGRGMGPGARGQGWGAGFGGFGFRRGYGSFGYGPYSSGSVAAGSLTDDAAALRATADSLKSELEAVQKRLQELEGRQ